MQNLFDLKGKVAIVTGCKRGIGMEMAIGLAEAGADILRVHDVAETRQALEIWRALRGAG